MQFLISTLIFLFLVVSIPAKESKPEKAFGRYCRRGENTAKCLKRLAKRCKKRRKSSCERKKNLCQWYKNAGCYPNPPAFRSRLSQYCTKNKSKNACLSDSSKKRLCLWSSSLGYCKPKIPATRKGINDPAINCRHKKKCKLEIFDED